MVEHQAGEGLCRLDAGRMDPPSTHPACARVDASTWHPPGPCSWPLRLPRPCPWPLRLTRPCPWPLSGVHGPGLRIQNSESWTQDGRQPTFTPSPQSHSTPNMQILSRRRNCSKKNTALTNGNKFVKNKVMLSIHSTQDHLHRFKAAD